MDKGKTNCSKIRAEAIIQIISFVTLLKVSFEKHHADAVAVSKITYRISVIKYICFSIVEYSGILRMPQQRSQYYFP